MLKPPPAQTQSHLPHSTKTQRSARTRTVGSAAISAGQEAAALTVSSSPSQESFVTLYTTYVHHSLGSAASLILTSPVPVQCQLLLDFGYTHLCLPEHWATIDLGPGDILFFDAKVVHYTQPHPGYSGDKTDQWEVSCLLQACVLSYKCKHHAKHNELMDAIQQLAAKEPFTKNEKQRSIVLA